jgi:membrane protein DedA with SNARE-associated domain
VSDIGAAISIAQATGSSWRTTLLTVSLPSDAWAYLPLFLAVVAGGAGVPMVGTAAVSAAAVLASQHVLAIDDVVAVACVAAVLGGVLGYWVGQRWGLSAMERPGRYEDERRKALARGHELYGRWGWLACFVIPSFIAGIAGMTFAMFLIFNSIAAVTYQFATALPAYGAGKVVSGHAGTTSIIELAAGVGLLVFIALRLARRRRRARGGESAGAAQA